MTKKLFVQILFFGSLWGLIEATLGYVLHWIPATISGSILFPIAGLILYKAYQQTQSRWSLMYIGMVAASIKAVNFYLPQINVFKTINPMMSILLEAMLVVLVVNLLVDTRPQMKYIAFPIASLGWRALFIGWMYFLLQTTGNMAPYLKSTAAAIDFVVLSGLLSGAIGSVLVLVADRVTFKVPQLSTNWIFASMTLVLAIVTTLTL